MEYTLILVVFGIQALTSQSLPGYTAKTCAMAKIAVEKTAAADDITVRGLCVPSSQAMEAVE